MSVKIVDYKFRQSLDGKPFIALVLQGGIEIVKSASGNSYATAKTCSMPTTFTEQVCASLVGSELPGSIQRIEVEPYNYTVEDTGEIILLSHRYEYVEEEKPAPQVFKVSGNGVPEMA